MTNKRGLGKGFEALLSANFDAAILSDQGQRIHQLALAAITPNRQQPRHSFDQTALGELAASLKRYGMLQPVIVTPLGDNKYQLIAGERRWRAAKLAGLAKIPALVRTSQDLERLEIALIENVQRVDLSLLEQAASIERLHQQFNLSYDTIGQRLGKASSTVSNLARLLQLPDAARQALAEQRISEGHGRQILSLKDHPAKQQELLDLIIKHSWSVRQAERFVTAFKASAPDTAAHDLAAKIRSETPETKRLSQKIGAPVSIRRTARGGKLEIGFGSNDELEKLLGLLDKL